MGPKTINLINSQNAYQFYNDLLETRRQYFISLAKSSPKQAGFLNGWLDRLKINFKELSETNKTNIKCN